jgi:hypothetical protein
MLTPKNPREHETATLSDHYAPVLSQAKQLEQLLRSGFAAEGRGLHELVTSVQGQLPEALIRKLRFIATVRNRLVHESAGDQIDDLDEFLRTCAAAEAELRRLILEKTPVAASFAPRSPTTAQARGGGRLGAVIGFLIFLVCCYVIWDCLQSLRTPDRPEAFPESPIRITPGAPARNE